jgi:hypothetical protein
MLSPEVQSDLRLLQRGQLDLTSIPSFAGLAASALVAELLAEHAIIFQQRSVGRKHEIGLARSVIYRLEFRKKGSALVALQYLVPQLKRCYFISAYDDQLSEITWIPNISLKRAKSTQRGLRIFLGAGVKLDRTIDGWKLKPVPRTTTFLSEDLLSQRGWQLDVLPPFSPKQFAWTP